MLARVAVACLGLVLLGGMINPVSQVSVVSVAASGDAPICFTRGRMIDDEPVVVPACVATDLEAKAAWKQNIRFLTNVFHALDDLQTEPLMDSVWKYRASGSWQDRHTMMRDLRMLSRLLHFAAETQRLTGRYLPEAGARSHILAAKTKLAAAALDGPMMWLLPARQDGMEMWSSSMFSLLISVTPILTEHYELAENTLHQCDFAGGPARAFPARDTYWQRSDLTFQ